LDDLVSVKLLIHKGRSDLRLLGPQQQLINSSPLPGQGKEVKVWPVAEETANHTSPNSIHDPIRPGDVEVGATLDLRLIPLPDVCLVEFQRLFIILLLERFGIGKARKQLGCSGSRVVYTGDYRGPSMVLVCRIQQFHSHRLASSLSLGQLLLVLGLALPLFNNFLADLSPGGHCIELASLGFGLEGHFHTTDLVDVDNPADRVKAPVLSRREVVLGGKLNLQAQLVSKDLLGITLAVNPWV